MRRWFILLCLAASACVSTPRVDPILGGWSPHGSTAALYTFTANGELDAPGCQVPSWEIPPCAYWRYSWRRTGPGAYQIYQYTVGNSARTPFLHGVLRNGELRLTDASGHEDVFKRAQ